jgi:hypothetical protein
MDRSITPCMVETDGTISSLKRLEFSDKLIDEDFLQDLMDRFPQIIPIDAIDSSYGPLISLGREIDNIDNLYISPNGRITVVEAKLWRNPQAIREVIAQILDYATRISNWSYEEFERKVQTKSRVNGSLFEHVYEQSSDDMKPEAESEFIDAVQNGLSNGRFQLLIVGDGIRENLEMMVDSLHTHPQKQFSFGLLELQVFQDAAIENKLLVLPRLSLKTTEVVRGIIKIDNTADGKISVNVEHREEKPTESSQRRINLTEQEFYDRLPGEEARNGCRAIIETLEQWGVVPGWRTVSVSLQLPASEDPSKKFTLFVLTTEGELYFGWLSDQLERTGRSPQIAVDLIEEICHLFPMVSKHPNPKWIDAIQPHVPNAALLESQDRFCDLMEGTIHKIKDAKSRKSTS